MPTPAASHVAGEGEYSQSRVENLGAGRPAEIAFTASEQDLPVREQARSHVTWKEGGSNSAEGAGDRVIQFGFLLPGNHDIAVGQ